MTEDPKPWYSSKSIIGALVAALSLVLGSLFGIKVDAAAQALIVDQATALVSALATAIGLIMAIYGRLVAKRPIGTVDASDASHDY